MDLALARRILIDRRIAYAITDRQLLVTEVGGVIEILGEASTDWPGRPLATLVPELVGSESVLGDILAGKLPRLELPRINRETPEGQILYLKLVDLPYRDEQGQILGLLHLVEDGTEAGVLKQHLSQSRNELRLAQEQLAQQNLELATANAELQRLNDLKSTFVSVAAHELRSPLTSIQAYLEMLIDEEVGPLSDDQHQYLAIIQSSADRLVHITSSLLDVTRIEAGRVELVLIPTDLPALVQGVAAEYKPQVTSRGQHLAIDHPPELAPALCDPTRASQILGNLLSNAIKYSHQNGHIRISLAPAQDEGFLQVTVADDGVGIGPQDQDKIFNEPIINETKRNSHGLGLLFIHDWVMSVEGSSIMVDYDKNTSMTTFSIEVPLCT